MEKAYDVDYFIAKFEAIPEELWCRRRFENTRGQRCANGHCSYNDGKGWVITKEVSTLYHLFKDLHVTTFNYGSVFDMHLREYSNKVALINNGMVMQFQQPTPKQRVLAALQDIKRKQYPQLTHPPVTAEQVIEQLEGVVNITA